MNQRPWAVRVTSLSRTKIFVVIRPKSRFGSMQPCHRSRTALAWYGGQSIRLWGWSLKSGVPHHLCTDHFSNPNRAVVKSVCMWVRMATFELHDLWPTVDIWHVSSSWHCLDHFRTSVTYVKVYGLRRKLFLKWKVSKPKHKLIYYCADRVHSRKRNVTVWRPSVCLSCRYTHVTHHGAACDAASVHFGPTIRRTDIPVCVTRVHIWFNTCVLCVYVVFQKYMIAW